MLKVFFLAAFITAALFPTQQAMAASMNEHFSPTNASGSFTTTAQTLSISYTETQVSESQVVLTVNIHPITNTPADIPAPDPDNPSKIATFEYTNGTNANSSNPEGRVGTEANLGYWNSIFGNEIKPINGTGIWIDYGVNNNAFITCITPIASNPLTTYAFYDPDCYKKPDGTTVPPVSLVPYILRNDTSGKMRMLGTDITFNVQINGLTPGTEYAARIRLEEEGASVDTASTPLVTFTTKAAGSGLLTTTQIQNEGAAESTIDPETGLPSCGVFGEKSSILGCVAQIVYSIIFKPTSTLMVLAGEIMDWGIGFSIDSSSYPVSGHSFVTDGWRIMRDLANILFIFILVYVAISTIFGKDEKRLIAMVIVVALIINFSLFVTKVIVDLGNITSRFFYNNISITNTQAGNAEIIGTAGHKSISYGFAATFNPIKIFSGLSPQTTISTAGGITHTGLDSPNQYATFFTLFSVVGAIVNLVAAFVFFSLAWLFIARTAGIWLSMIFAPLAFLSLTLPDKWKKGIAGTGQYTSFGPWFSNLASLSFMPVIALLMIFLILTFLKAPGLLGALTSQTTTGQLMTVLIPLIVLTILLLKTKDVASKWSGEFGTAMSKVGSFVGGAALGVATGGAALVGRKVIGGGVGNMLLAGGDKRANSKREGFAGRVERSLGRSMLYTGDKAQKATFDARNTGLGARISKGTGYDLNNTLGMKSLQKDSLKGGFAEMKKKQMAKETDFAKSLEIGGGHELKVEQSRLEAAQREAEREKTLFGLDPANKDDAAGKEKLDKKVKAAKLAVSQQKQRVELENNRRKAQYAKDLEASNFVELEGLKGVTPGALKGAAIGGTVGSILPGFGTAVGAGIGAGVGAGMGALGRALTFSEDARAEAISKIRSGQKSSKSDAEKLAEDLSKFMKKDGKKDDDDDAAPKTPAPASTPPSTGGTSAVGTTSSTSALGSIVAPIIVGGAKPAAPLTPLQTLSGVDDYRKSQPKSQTGYPIRQNAPKAAPRPNAAAGPTLAPTPKPAPKPAPTPAPAPGPNNNGFSSPTFS
ncbi:MAG TPA: hypothetical protein PK950_00880 [Candidatus Paceibacterota bacterium]|nr:hypothetical protein [Candidatus Paceibacterota bacterium]